MTVPVAAARQATFCTDPADTVSGNSIRKGNIELPIIDEFSVQSETRCVSQASSVEHSSPIYGSKSALRRFKEECRTRKVKAPSALDDSSELEILSDVGLAGDSDSEVVPIVTPLSLSARSKLRKQPRIKVPSSKIDNTEPTIQEETTQDILASHTPVKDTPTNGVVHDIQSQIRSKTVVVDKRSKTDKKRKGKVPESPINDKAFESIGTVDVGAQSGHILSSNDKKAGHVHELDRLNKPIAEYEAESSFCESDWQPKKSEHSSDLPSSAKTDNVHAEFITEDKNVIAHKYDREIKSVLKSTPDQRHLESSFEIHKKRPRSSGDENKPRKEQRSLSKRTSEHDNPVKKVSFAKTVKPGTGQVSSSRPKSADLPPPQTPLISEFCSDVNTITTHRVTTRVEQNESVSGIPKRGVHQRDIPGSVQRVEIWQAEPRTMAGTSDNMATSDGYDYESETFEEVLQERNAMVKAERTYQRRIKQLEEELKGMINQCQELSDENKELRKTIDEFKNKNETETTVPEENNNDTVVLASRVAKLETEKENLVKVNEKLSLALKENDGKRKQSDIVFVENTKLKNKNSELEKKVSALEKELELMSTKLKELNVDKTGKASVMEFKYRELEVALVDMRKENDNLKVKVSSAEKEKKFLTNTLDEKRTELNEVLRAMQNETVTESDLKHSREKLKSAQQEIDSVKKELDDMKRVLQDSETNKQKLRGVIAQREAEVKRVKGDQEHKDRVILDLRHSLEKSKEEIHKYQESESNTKDVEKETNALKSRIGSLKAEIESSIQENQRLKREREEVNYELNRLRNENVAASDAIVESKRYFRKWEIERDARNKAEVQLAQKHDEVEHLDTRVKDSGNKVNVLYSRLRALEDDRNRYKGPNAQELETNNKVLHDENKKLRQMLVERNIELVNKQNEKEVMHSRMDVLERSQKDAEVRVRQLSGWVNSVDGDSVSSARDGPSKAQTKGHLPPRHPNAPNNNNNNNNKASSRHPTQTSTGNSSHQRPRPMEPKIAFVSPRSRKKGIQRNAHHTMTPPPGWEKSQNNPDHENSNHTPLSLPLIDSKSTTPPDPSGGYFQMYKEKMKKMQERRY